LPRRKFPTRTKCWSKLHEDDEGQLGRTSSNWICRGSRLAKCEASAEKCETGLKLKWCAAGYLGRPGLERLPGQGKRMLWRGGETTPGWLERGNGTGFLNTPNNLVNEKLQLTWYRYFTGINYSPGIVREDDYVQLDKNNSGCYQRALELAAKAREYGWHQIRIGKTEWHGFFWIDWKSHRLIHHVILCWDDTKENKKRSEPQEGSSQKNCERMLIENNFPEKEGQSYPRYEWLIGWTGFWSITSSYEKTSRGWKFCKKQITERHSFRMRNNILKALGRFRISFFKKMNPSFIHET